MSYKEQVGFEAAVLAAVSSDLPLFLQKKLMFLMA
jgi:hypothetical protein